jgi:DNA primase small subunit
MSFVFIAANTNWCRRSLRILKDDFPSVLADQDPWASSPDALLALLPDAQLNNALQSKWESAPGRSSQNKWSDIDALASSGASSTLDPKTLLDAKQDIVLEYTYPRLDAEVSKKLNHLLKSPFCVHPKTGKVCVPIDARRAEEFDPFTVPTVLELLGDIDAWHAEHKGDESGAKIPDWEKTKLKPYVDYFRGFVNGLLKDEKPKRAREEGDPMEF